MRHQLLDRAIGLLGLAAGEPVGEGMERHRVDPAVAREQRQNRLVELDPAGAGEIEGAADAAAGKRGQRLGLRLGQVGPVAQEQQAHDPRRQRRQRKPPAPRADRRQEPPRAVRHQEQEHATRRLLEDFEERIGGVAVHLVGAVDDDDAPAALGRGQPQKSADLAGVLDDDLAAQPAAARVVGALDRQEIGMPARGHPAKDAAVRGNRQPAFADITLIGSIIPEQPAGRALPCPVRQHETRKAKRQRRLADAARPAQQQRMRQPAGLEQLPQRTLGGFVADEIGVRARRRRRSGRGVVRAVPAASHSRTIPRRAATVASTARCTLP